MSTSRINKISWQKVIAGSLLVALGSWTTPWWLALVVVGGLLGWISVRESRGQVFAQAFVAAGLGWLALCLWQDVNRGFLLSKRLAGLFGSDWGLTAYIVCFVFAGLLGAASALFGMDVHLLLSWKKFRTK